MDNKISELVGLASCKRLIAGGLWSAPARHFCYERFPLSSIEETSNDIHANQWTKNKVENMLRKLWNNNIIVHTVALVYVYQWAVNKSKI